MKKLLLSFSGILILTVAFAFVVKPKKAIPPPAKTFHELSIKALDGKTMIHFSSFKGKKVLLVNTASQCGFTPQYSDLQKLADTYKDKLVVIGFPCNQFGEQEPGSSAEIKQFCSARYNITFPLTEKIDVKGDHQNDVYTWLTNKKYNKAKDVNVRWNFGKFLVDENGKLIDYFPSQVSPLDEKIVSLIAK